MASKASNSDVVEPSTGRIAWKRGLVSAVMAFIIGGLAAWGTSQLGFALPAFVIMVAISGYHLYQKPIATKALGIGLYYAAATAVLVPFLFYIPTILAPGDGATGAGTFIGSVLGFFIWGALFGVVAILMAALGYFVNKRANKKLDTAN